MEMGGRGNRGSQKNKISYHRIHITEERRSGETHSGEIEKNDNSNERNMEHWERIFKENFERRKKMFDTLEGSVTLYGAEIWR